MAATTGYARALAAVPDDGVVAMRAYRQGLAAGDYVLAGKAAAALVRGGGAPPDTAILALAIALRSGDAKGAEAAVARIEAGPLDFLAPVLRAWLARDRGEDGVAALDAAPANALGSRYVSRHRALLLLASRRAAEAMAALTPLLSGAEDDPDLRIDAARLFAGIGEGDAARALVGQGPGGRRLLSRRGLGSAKADAAFGASRLFLALASDVSQEDMLPLSIVLTRSALLLDPQDDRARLYLGEALSRDGADDLALAVLAEVERDSPFARGAQSGRVSALDRAGRTGEALAAAQAMAADRQATSADARTYGDMLEAAGRFGEAAQAYGRAIALAGDVQDWQLHYLHGRALDRADRWSDALPALTRAVALAPEQAEALQYLGSAQLRRGGDPREAEALLEKARLLAPDDAGIADALAWAYYRRGDVARALPLLESAAQGDPGGTGVNEHLGDAYWRLGRHYEARYAWRAAALYADNAAASRIEAKLEHGLVRNP